jgi:hypothetical protein
MAGNGRFCHVFGHCSAGRGPRFQDHEMTQVFILQLFAH